MAHTNFVSSIRWRPSQHLIYTNTNKNQIFGISNLWKSKRFRKIKNICICLNYMLLLFCFFVKFVYSVYFVYCWGPQSLTSFTHPRGDLYLLAASFAAGRRLHYHHRSIHPRYYHLGAGAFAFHVLRQTPSSQHTALRTGLAHAWARATVRWCDANENTSENTSEPR